MLNVVLFKSLSIYTRTKQNLYFAGDQNTSEWQTSVINQLK